MEKTLLLESLRNSLRDGSITEQELRSLLGETGVTTAAEANSDHRVMLSDVLYYVGGGIVFIGIGIFAANHWEDMGSAMRIFVTLGLGIASFISAVLLTKSGKMDRLPDALHLVAGLLIPGGVFVTLDELGFRGGSWGPGLIFLGFTLLYLLAYLLYRRGVLALFGVLYGTFATLLLSSAVIGDLPLFSGDKFAAYRILGIGAAYLFLAYGLVETKLRSLAWWLYGFGALAVLASALWLSGWKPEQSMFWELSYPLLVFGAMFISTKLKSRAMLFFGAVFLVGYIFKITGEYFQDSLSWPLLLILAGFLLMGVGYLTFYLNKRYLKTGN